MSNHIPSDEQAPGRSLPRLSLSAFVDVVDLQMQLGTDPQAVAELVRLTRDFGPHSADGLFEVARPLLLSDAPSNSQWQTLRRYLESVSGRALIERVFLRWTDFLSDDPAETPIPCHPWIPCEVC